MASMQVCTLLHIHYSGTHKPMEKEDDINEILAMAYFQLFKWPPPTCTLCDCIQSTLGRKIDFLFGLTTVICNYWSHFKGIIKNNKLSRRFSCVEHSMSIRHHDRDSQTVKKYVVYVHLHSLIIYILFRNSTAYNRFKFESPIQIPPKSSKLNRQ